LSHSASWLEVFEARLSLATYSVAPGDKHLGFEIREQLG
jgi:hypothetical protein